ARALSCLAFAEGFEQLLLLTGNVGHFDGDRGILAVYPIAGHKHQGGTALRSGKGRRSRAPAPLKNSAETLTDEHGGHVQPDLVTATETGSMEKR
ncbi:MAG TPA: hypothetical protein VEH31_06605, partial [Streptosporangiaceae bacterium]|nr:hypothetical protein [Streptosporangiaceae bacterium]